MTKKNYTRALVTGILFFILTPCAQASSRTWYINNDTNISNIQNNIDSNQTTATGTFLDGDNITIALDAANPGIVYTLTINEPTVIIGNLLWCSELSPIQLEPGAVDIGTGTASKLTVRPNSKNINIGFINISGSSATLVLDSSNLAPNATSAQKLNSLPALSTYASSKNATTFTGISFLPLIKSDDYGLLELNASNYPLGYSFPINVGLTNRLRSLTFSGDHLIEGDISQEIYAKNVIFATSGNVILPPLIMGDDSTITLRNDLAIGTVSSTTSSSVTAVSGYLSLSGSSTIDLGSYKFNIIQVLNSSSIYGFTYSAAPTDTGLVVETENVEIKTYFDKTLQRGMGDGGRFILDASTQVKIDNNMTITLSTNANAAGLSYNLFSGAGTIDVPVADRILGNQNSSTDSTTLLSHQTITFNQPTPGVIYWTYDRNGHVISSHINPVQVVPPPNGLPYSPEVPTPNPAVPVIYFTDTSVLPQVNITAAVARLVPSISDKVAIDEANDTAIKNIATRVFKIPEDDSISSSGVSSGDVDKQYSGVWFSPFIQKARQKDTHDTYGYKINNYGSTLGVDRMFSENLALGIAWTTLESHVKLSGFKVGDKSNVNTNILSIYSLYNLPKRWFVQSHASAGQGNVEAIEWRYNSDSSLGIATAKYKSYSYNAQASLGKRIYITPLIDFIPSIGMVYNNVRSDGYRESGDVPTISVAKRSSYALDALLGAKLIGRCEYQNYVLKPELMAAAQLNIAKRNMKVNYTASFLKPITFDVRQSKRWYSVGVGMTLYKGLMEYAVNYEAQVDKGYLGHVGIIKIRMNF